MCLYMCVSACVCNVCNGVYPVYQLLGWKWNKWNKPLHRGTGVSTVPCLIFDAEGRTLKFCFGHMRVRSRKDADSQIIKWKRKYSKAPFKNRVLSVSFYPSGLIASTALKGKWSDPCNKFDFCSPEFCTEFSWRRFIVGNRRLAVSVITIMVVAQWHESRSLACVC